MSIGHDLLTDVGLGDAAELGTRVIRDSLCSASVSVAFRGENRLDLLLDIEQRLGESLQAFADLLFVMDKHGSHTRVPLGDPSMYSDSFQKRSRKRPYKISCHLKRRQIELFHLLKPRSLGKPLLLNFR
ncbi:MAG: hypothetical protein MZU91_02135 [Desulfosudis oleivorans]|nr:hypothetical protein [Desulfosudis oleivorans]